MTPSELAALEALVAAERLRQTGLAVDPDHDSRIAANATLGEELPMCEIKGPYRDRKKWRVRILDTVTGRSVNRIFDTEALALEAIPKLQAEYRRPIGLPMSEALTAYEGKVKQRQRKPTSRTSETVLGRLRSVLIRRPTEEADEARITGEVDKDTAHALWNAYRTRQTHSSKPPSTDTQVNTLKALRAFWGFLVTKGWAKVDPFEGIEVEGRRHSSKPQLRKDDARVLKTLATSRAEDGDEGAIAALMALFLGLRASEIVDRLVGDIDADGTELVIEHAKTAAGNRVLMLPEVLQPFLARLAKGKGKSDRLFSNRDRQWLHREIVKLCADAGVKRVTPHGLRGTASSLAQSGGMIGSAVAASLGHESYGTTAKHYTDPSVPANAAIARVVAALN